MTNVHQELVVVDNEDISESLCTNNEGILYLKIIFEYLCMHTTCIGATSINNVHQKSKYIPQSLCAQSSSTSNEDVENIPCNSAENRLISIKLPPKMKKRGRPKGAETTVVGLRRKKLKSGPVAFENLLPETIMLSWFIGETEVLKGKTVTEDMVEVIPEKVDNACINECVCLTGIKRFFTIDAWRMVMDIIALKEENCEYYCPVCKHEIDDLRDSSINCNACLQWLHLRCSGLKKAPQKRNWFYSFCKNGY